MLFIFSFLFYLGVNPIDVENFLGAKIIRAFTTTTSADVPANPFNNLAAQLNNKENSLNAKEQDLNDIQNNLSNQTDALKRWLVYIVPLVIALFILVLINFYFDYKERKMLSKLEENEIKIIEAEKRLEEKIDKKD